MCNSCHGVNWVQPRIGISPVTDQLRTSCRFYVAVYKTTKWLTHSNALQLPNINPVQLYWHSSEQKSQLCLLTLTLWYLPPLPSCYGHKPLCNPLLGFVHRRTWTAVPDFMVIHLIVVEYVKVCMILMVVFEEKVWWSHTKGASSGEYEPP